MKSFLSLIDELFTLIFFRVHTVVAIAEVTGKAIEETAAVLVRIYHDRKNKCFLPRISKRY